jgi:hypothetical protein
MGLQIYINLDDQNRVVQGRSTGTPAAPIRLKAGGETLVEFRFLRNGAVVSLGVAPTLRFAAKAAGERDSDPILESLAAAFTIVSTPGDYYAEMVLNANTVALWDLFNSDADAGNDVLLAELDAELLWTVAGKTQRTPSGFSFLMENPVIRDEDLPPTDPEETYPDPTAIVVTGDIGVSVAPLVAGKVPAANVDNWATVPGTPAASSPPVANGDLTVEKISNTELRFSLKGSDGVIRSNTLTLA